MVTAFKPSAENYAHRVLYSEDATSSLQQKMHCEKRLKWEAKSEKNRGLEGKRGTRKLMNVQVSPSPRSKVVDPNEQKIRQKWQKACIGEQELLTELNELKHKKQMYRTRKQGQITWEK